MQAMSAIEIEHRRPSQLTCWMGFDAGNVSNQNRAQEALTTHCLDGILMQAMSAIKIEHRRPSQPPYWMGFDAGNVSN
jgi:hypothetical protein